MLSFCGGVRFKGGDAKKALFFWLSIFGLLGIALGQNLAQVQDFQAQDYNRLQPHALPRSDGDAKVEDRASSRAEKNESEEILIPELKGIVFIGLPKDVKSDGSNETGIHLVGVPELEVLEMKTQFQRYLGRPITFKQINELVQEVILYCRTHQYSVVDVLIPEQEVRTGTLQILVIIGKLGGIKVEGNRWFSSEQITNNFRLNKGEALRSSIIFSDLDWVNQNSFRQTNLIYSRGSETGETDVTLQVKDRFPVRFYYGYNETGSDFTGDERQFIGFNYGDVWGLGHEMNYQYTTSADMKMLLAHSGSYLVPLPWRHKILIYGSHATVEPIFPSAVFKQNGVTWQTSARYIVPLVNVLKYEHELQVGGDFKQSNNDLEFSGISVSADTYEVNQFVLQYGGSLPDPYGSTSFGVRTFISLNEGTLHHDDVSFQRFRSQAKAKYNYQTCDFQRVNRLPYGFSWMLHGNAQWTQCNLIQSEKMGLGGADSIRGYEEWEGSGDRAWRITNELRFPSQSLSGFIQDEFSKEIGKDRLQTLLFWDYGVAENDTLLSGEDPHVILSSIGPGMRYSFNTWMNLRFDYGFQLTDSAQAGAGRGSSRGHLSVVMSY